MEKLRKIFDRLFPLIKDRGKIEVGGRGQFLYSVQFMPTFFLQNFINLEKKPLERKGRVGGRFEEEEVSNGLDIGWSDVLRTGEEKAGVGINKIFFCSRKTDRQIHQSNNCPLLKIFFLQILHRSPLD